ncbi:hypothetical protein VPH35_020198 [Triticum aestivum]
MTYRCRSAASGLPPLAYMWLPSSGTLGLASSCIVVVAIVQPTRARRTTAFGGLGLRPAGSEGDTWGETYFDVRRCHERSSFVPEGVEEIIRVVREGGLGAPRSNVVLPLSLFGNHGLAAVDVVRRRVPTSCSPSRFTGRRRMWYGGAWSGGAGRGGRRWDWEAVTQGRAGA